MISTPSIFVDGKLVYAGVVDYDELLKILQDKKVIVEVNKDELVNKLMFGVVNSFAATAWLYVNRDFDALMAQKDFVLAVTGLSLVDDKSADEYYTYLRNIIVKEGEKYVDEWKEKMLRVIATNFIRELYLLYRKKLSDEEIMRKYPLEVFAHWLMIRGGAVGRVGLRIHPLSDNQVLEKISEVYVYTLSNAKQLWDKVIKEQEELAKKSALYEQARFISI